MKKINWDERRVTTGAQAVREGLSEEAAFGLKQRSCPVEIWRKCAQSSGVVRAKALRGEGTSGAHIAPGHVAWVLKQAGPRLGRGAWTG